MSELQIYFSTQDMAEKIGITEDLFMSLYRRKHPNIEPKNALTPRSKPLWNVKAATKTFKNFEKKGFEDAILLDSGMMMYPEVVDGESYYLHCVNSTGGYEMLCSKNEGVFAVYSYQGKTIKTEDQPLRFEYAAQLRNKCKERRDEFEEYKR